MNIANVGTRNKIKYNIPPSLKQKNMDKIIQEHELLLHSALLDHLTKIVPCILMIINQDQRIVFKNQHKVKLFAKCKDEDIIGSRPGDLVACKHAHEAANGCGTSEFCCECGLLQSIITAQANDIDSVNEWRISTVSGGTYEFKVCSAPYVYKNRHFTMVSLLDITDEKRRHALEKTFFHDINNILTVVMTGSELLEFAQDQEDIHQYVKLINLASKQLSDEIASQRRLLQAENGQLAVRICRLNSLNLLTNIVDMFSDNTIWKKRCLVINKQADPVEIITDLTLLRRIIVNMVKNALEAVNSSEEIMLNCYKDEKDLIFSVHNPGYVPQNIQLQIFQRSFSTKGVGRGIGTYSMRLFGEKYLQGHVWFTTSKKLGTTFFIALPKECSIDCFSAGKNETTTQSEAKSTQHSYDFQHH